MSFKPFTKRVLGHPRIQAHPSSPSPTDDSIVIAIKDELLVMQGPGGAFSQKVRDLLANNLDHPTPSIVLTTVYAGVAAPGGNDVDILQLTLPPNFDIFEATDYVRSHHTLKAPERRQVSPNHILVPAPSGDLCPSGPPKPFPGKHPALPPAALSAAGWFQPVYVLDAGYQWGPNTWGKNPFIQRGHLTSVQANYYVPVASPGGLPPEIAWPQFALDTPDANKPGEIGHLEGHANFVAGVIAQRCPSAEITVWNINGGFVTSDAYSLPTEAVVLHALAMIPVDPPPVINCGFAFLPYAAQIPVGTSGVFLSWDDALARFDNVGGIVVAPAGNQFGSTLERYPAAHANVVGVASHDAIPDGGVGANPSNFSNVGPWVTCSANGSNVVSSFLHLKMKVEGGGLFKKDFTNNWAMWNGTSFAAPKVAAAIAKGANALRQPKQAFADLVNNHAAPKDPQLGIVFADTELL